jgi:hypothetical protein
MEIQKGEQIIEQDTKIISKRDTIPRHGSVFICSGDLFLKHEVME